jgi:hypothetical protein
MPFTPARVLRALDPDALVAGARVALLANATVAGLVGASVHPEVAPEGAPSPYIVLALASVVYESRYNDPAINALMDVSAYTTGWSTTTIRALIPACLTALIDTPWTATGLLLNAVTMEESGAGFRQVSAVTNGTMVRGRQFTIRVHASKV